MPTRRGEEDFGLQGMGDVLMRRELLSVVEGDGVHEVADWLEATHMRAYAVKFVPCHLLPRGIAMLYESGRGQRRPHFNRLREKDRSSLHVTC
jgi:hypothetical protein